MGPGSEWTLLTFGADPGFLCFIVRRKCIDLDQAYLGG